MERAPAVGGWDNNGVSKVVASLAAQEDGSVPDPTESDWDRRVMQGEKRLADALTSAQFFEGEERESSTVMDEPRT
jgi:hypothetical protein